MSTKALLFFSGVLLLILSVVFGVALGYYQAQRELAGVDCVKEENLEQASKISAMQEEMLQVQDELARVREKLAEVNTLEEKVRSMVGLQEADGRGGGRGGPAGSSPSLPSRGGLVDRAAQLNKDLDRRTAELQALEGQLKNRLAYLSAVPSFWPVQGRVTSSFGVRSSPFSGRPEFHNGIDLSVPVGAPVVAAGDGKVVFAGWRSGYGKLVIIEHGYGFRTLYGHNSAILVKNGERVKRGQVISKAGNTGFSTGPHVHFAIEKNGQYVDPMQYLS